MNLAQITCDACSGTIPEESFNSGPVHCKHCGVFIRADVFPALVRPPEVHSGNSVIENEASCFFHDQKKAVVPCGSCGRFLCSLCDIEFEGGHICPTCLSSGQKKHKFKNMENKRVLYDNIALSITILPSVFWFITFFTAPLALYFVIRYWKAPSSIIPRSKIRFICAAVFAVGQITAWTLLVYSMLKGLKWI